MEKYKAIQIIKERIISEHRKHKGLNWEEIAARKIYASLVKLFTTPNVSHKAEQLFCEDCGGNIESLDAYCKHCGEVIC